MQVRRQLNQGTLFVPDSSKEFSTNTIKMGQRDHVYKDDIKGMKFDSGELKMDCKQFYPQELVYEMMIPGTLLKKVEGLKKIHKMIDLSKDSGLITRQEIVSMMPPILNDIQSHHSVLDMCAAPGSKTAQVLELIMNDHLNVKKLSNLE